MKLAPWFILALILLPVTAQAYHLSPLPDPTPGQVRDIRNRVLATRTVNLDEAAPGNLLAYTFPWDPEFTYADSGHTIRVHISYTMVIAQTSNGIWNITVAKEATGLLDSCSVHVETVNPTGITLDAVPTYPHFAWDCLFTQSTKAHPHNHTIWVNRTAFSGTPNTPFSETVSVRLETEDVILLPNTHQNVTDHRNHTIEVTMHENQFAALGFDGFIILLFWIAALLFFTYQAWLFAAGFSLPGIFNTILPIDFPGDFTQWFVFCLLGVILEVAANRFQWGHHKPKVNT